MGVDWTAYAAIGCAVPREKLFRRQTVKVGDHDFDQSVRFHPQTGRKLWEEKDVPISGFGPDSGYFGPEGQFYVVETTPNDRGISRTYVICAVKPVKASKWSIDGHHGHSMATLDIAGLIEAEYALRAILEPLGLWDSSQFGIHAVLCCSY